MTRGGTFGSGPIPDEALIGFRLDEALRHLREVEALVPENTRRWRFVLAAQAAVEASKVAD